MADNRIGLNLVTLKGGLEADRLVANLDRARAAGFRSVGLWVQTLKEWVARGRSMESLGRELGARDLKADEVCFVVVPEATQALDEQKRVFRWAKELDAGCVISIYSKPENPLERARADWERFMREVEDSGVPAAFEFIGPWPQYNSPMSALAVIEGAALGRMVIDTFHFWRGGGDLSEISGVPAGRVALVHLNDAKDVPRASARDSDRTYPGEGVIPLADICGALVRNGYKGPFSVEIFGQAQEDDPDRVCRHACRTAAQLIERL
jgi:sugar phosphate isomerase/epimerase